MYSTADFATTLSFIVSHMLLLLPPTLPHFYTSSWTVNYYRSPPFLVNPPSLPSLLPLVLVGFSGGFFLLDYCSTLLTSNTLPPSLKIPVTYLYPLWPVTYLATLYQIFTRQTPLVLLDLLTDYSGSSVPSSSPPYFLLPISSSFLLPQPSVLLR